MREIGDVIFISAPLCRDREARRWYSDGAGTCVVLTDRGRLLDPSPVFGPTSYRLLARQVRLAEARSFALTHDLPHERPLTQRTTSS